MRVLRQGDSGLQVKFLQRLLNKANVRAGIHGTFLEEDGDFGPLTENALYTFQTRTPGLVKDKIVGTHTWHALGLRQWKEHNWVRLVPQTPGTATCWTAAASMIKGPLTVGSGGAPVDSGGLDMADSSLRMFAQSLGWEYLEYTPPVRTLVDLVCRTPIWLAVECRYLDYSSAGTHAVVPSAVYSDGDPAGDGTLFRMHDPYPKGIGRIFGTFADPICVWGVDFTDIIPLRDPHSFYVLVPR